MTRTRIHPSSQNVKVATDAVIFSVRNGEHCTLLVRMKKAPYEGAWAFPGGLIEDDERTADAAQRILERQTGIKGAFMEQLMTFDAPDRDELGRVVSVAYMALVPDDGTEPVTTDRYAEVRWVPVTRLPRLAYDHGEVAKVALDRLRAKLGYANVAWSALPKAFTLREMQDVYEAILGTPFDKRNFLKKVQAIGLVEPSGRFRKGGAGRPAALYRFRSRKPKVIDLV